jgi:hypothetical protein
MVFKSDDSPSYDQQQQQSNYIVFRNDRSLIYTAFFADFGPLNLGHSSIMTLHQLFLSIDYHRWHLASSSSFLHIYTVSIHDILPFPYLPSLYSIDLSSFSL